MRSDGRTRVSAARTARAIAVAACGVTAGCLVPTPAHDLRRGWGAIDDEVVAGFVSDRATRADVLLRLGEPRERRDSDHAFVYAWEVTQGYVIAGAGVPLRRRYYAAIRFDELGVATASTVVAPRLYYTAESDLEDWLRSAADADRESRP